MALVINHNLMALNTARNLSNHYGAMSTSTQRLSSGLRINSSADDAAGLAVRELMRSDIATMNQGIRNANDAISMIQTADGALQVIDEKLIRMKELAEQAATGTYTSDQRMIIDSEFQAMASEINRIAEATDFNGIKLLSDSSGLNSGLLLNYSFNGTLKDSSGNISAAITSNAKFAEGIGGSQSIVFDGTNNDLSANFNMNKSSFTYSLWFNVSDLHSGVSQIFTSTANPLDHRYEIQLLDDGSVDTYHTNSVRKQLTSDSELVKENQWYLLTNTYDNGEYKVYLNGNIILSDNSGTGAVDFSSPIYIAHDPWLGVADYEKFIGQTQDFRIYDHALSSDDIQSYYNGVVNGYNFTNWNTKIHFGTGNSSAEDYYYVSQYNLPATLGLRDYDVKTQSDAQSALSGLDTAIVKKDKIRANLGATQNRLENTISNLQIQAENLQAAESQISDTDVAQEMTTFVREQILTQAAVAMLSQANSMPKMALQLIEGGS